jgi:hypothetical protein
MPGIGGMFGGDRSILPGTIGVGIPAPGGPPIGMPIGFICTLSIGMLLLIILCAAYKLPGGAMLYGAAICTGVPYGPSTPGTIGGPKLLP